MLRRNGAFGDEARRHGAHTPSARGTVAAAATSQGGRRCCAARPFGSSAVPASASSITIRASPIAWTRRRASFSRQRRSSRSKLAGIPGGSTLQSGSVFSTAASVSAGVSPLHIRFPLSIS